MKLLFPVLFFAFFVSACEQNGAPTADKTADKIVAAVDDYAADSSDGSSADGSFADSSANGSSDGVLAVVNGVDIPKSRVTLYAPQDVPPQQLEGVVDNIIITELLSQVAEKSGLTERPDVREQLIVARQAVLGRAYAEQFLGENRPAEADYVARYEEIKKQYEGQLEYDVAHILVDDEKLARELLDKIKADSSQFGKLAKAHSKDSGSATQDGKLGWVTARNLVPEFAAPMTQATPGKVSDQLAKSKFGWHLILVNATRAIAIPPLDDTMRQNLAQAIQADLFTKHIDELRAAAAIEIKK